LPAHVTREQAISFAKAMLKGDPEEGAVIAQSVKGVIAGLFPHEHAEQRKQ
jgi:hypothetical protein